MILKQADSKETLLNDLERLAANASANAPLDRKKRIEQELRTVRAGMKGEQEAAYLIDFHFKDRESWIVVHDLRLEVNGRVAQIDHLLLHRCLDCYVLETKHFSSGMKITEDGEFLRWNHYRKTYEGMPSPLTQNDRHVAVLGRCIRKDRDAYAPGYPVITDLLPLCAGVTQGPRRSPPEFRLQSGCQGRRAARYHQRAD